MATESIDLSYIKSISNGSRAFELQMLETFVDQTAGEIEKIEKYNLQQDWQSLCACAHKIKLSFHFIGADGIWTLLDTIEDMIRSKKGIEKVPAMVSSFLKMHGKVLDDVKIEIKKYTDSKP